MTEEIDHRATLARAEQIIDLLRTCHIREGWESATTPPCTMSSKDCTPGAVDTAIRDGGLLAAGTQGGKHNH
jgi:hypothetical protein